MKFTGRILSTTLILVVSFNMAACKKPNTNKDKNIKSVEKSVNIKGLNLPAITIVTEKSNELYTLKDSYLNKFGKMNDAHIMDLIYDKDKDIYVLLLKVSQEGGKETSQIDIKIKNNNIVLKDSSTYADIRISPESDKILFRSFKDTSLNAPEGMRVYDIKRNKEIKLNTEVLVSGNIYQWVDNENIIYYGIIPDTPNSGKIYKYNLTTGEEKPYFDKLKGYCLGVWPISNEEILVLQNNQETYSLCDYNVKTGEKNHISQNIAEVGKVAVNKDKNILYFIGKVAESEKFALFSVDLSTFEFSQLTYDLPKNVDAKAGLALDEEGNVIFGGTDGEKNNDIYIYDVKNNSTNLVTENPNSYRIYKDN